MRYIKSAAIVFTIVVIVGVTFPAKASALTQPQISAIVALLQSFGVDQAVVTRIRVSLGDTSISSNTSNAASDSSKARKGKSSIAITEPKTNSTFSKDGDKSISIAWEAKNVPENTLIIIELEATKLYAGGVNSGGTWQSTIIPGDSEGSYEWNIGGVGREDPGKYKLRVLLQECVPGDCNANPFFPGMPKTKTLAKSSWRTLSIVGESSVGVTLKMGTIERDFFTADPDGQLTFNYYPTGTVEKCIATGYYEGGKESVSHSFKGGVGAGEYGRFSLDAVGAYPLLDLKSVTVECSGDGEKASDTIMYDVHNDELGSYQIVANGDVYREGTNKTEIEAISYCKKAANDSKIHKNTRVQCYWNDNKFEDISSFKG